MFPDSPFAVPVGSFQAPVVPPTTDPDKGPAAVVRIGCEWLPYIRGALTQLMLQTTWQTDSDGLQLVQQRVTNLIGLFQGNAPGDCGSPTSETIGFSSGCEDCEMGCCLRFNNGVLQQFTCGVWEDVPGQQGGASGQPGPVTGLPGPGQSGDWCFRLAPFSRVRLPATVNSGDVITIETPQGAWTNIAPVQWFCPSGRYYILGTCINAHGPVSTDPLPSADHGQIIAQINGDYVAVFNVDADGNPQPYTVPGGYVNATVDFLGNFADEVPGGTGGEVAFCANLQNNSAGTWEQVFDFVHSSYAGIWNFDDDSGAGYSPDHDGVWTSLLGLETNAITNGSSSFNLLAISSPIGARITHAEIVYNPDTINYHGGTGNDIFDLTADSTLLIHFTEPTMPSSPQTWDGDQTFSALHFRLLAGAEFCNCDPGGHASVSQITLRGIGSNPYL